MATAALDILQLSANQVLMVGDRTETDVFLGKLAGMDTALVLSGITKRKDIDSLIDQPTYIVNSVCDLI